MYTLDRSSGCSSFFCRLPAITDAARRPPWGSTARCTMTNVVDIISIPTMPLDL